ncbi:helix-turn-helix transcriptional regulator [Auraticoccus monumenti]|uniref:Predicted DNA-binding transcriptional regulator YafY, contains an HTH and WYL domains n=1 Tax=Auraticoccus monumenti TaxID=675864 RepID=A0A1G6XN72_9ACTN|nr:WYL domain-containing protein [Auraticoccus monumenti]SDD79193.1 Predicted DNA-binding transcriptional regulator YafY, contains an HTH and WYL domains [Auraticoccus monumenti]
MEDTAARPVSRALHVLALLQRHPGITAAQIAERLGVSDRAARRYVAVLREADISVESTPGRYGGYRLGPGLRLPPLLFSSSEALGLVMAVLDGQHAAADPEEPVGSALGKLVRALPGEVGRQAAVMREHALAAPERETTRPDPGTTAELVDAVAARRRVRLRYRTAGGRTTETVADPWATVVRHRHWYLLCHAHAPDAVRAYRVDRIERLEVLAEPFVPPADLDAVAVLEQHLGAGREHPTRVRFSAPLAEVAPHVGAPMGRLEPDGESACLLTGTTSDPRMYAGEWLAAIPHPFVVEGGTELVAAVGALAERLTAAVAGHVPPR